MENYTILHLDQDEEVILEVRKHWIIFASQFIFFIFSIFLPIVVYLTASFYVKEIALFVHSKLELFLFFYLVWFLIFWISLFLRWTKYFLDVWYVTEKRIIDVEQKRIFHREVSNLRFDKIQDVSVETNGFLATFLNYGDITVQTASENQDFFMTNVSNPEEVKRVIFNRHNDN